MKKILLLLFTQGVLFLYAQSPGGIPGAEVWMKTEPVSKDLQGNYHWQDYGGDNLKLRNYDPRGPLFGNEFVQARSKVRTYNFIPGLDLASMTSSQELLLKRALLSQATIIGLFGANSRFDQEMNLYGWNGRPGQGAWITTDKVIHSKESEKVPFDYGNETGHDLIYKSSDPEPNINEFREKSLRILSYLRSIPPSTGLWGEPTTNVFSLGHIYEKSNVNNTSQYDIPSNLAFWGTTPELIIFNRFLTPLERRKVESYLALKYGVTLYKSYIGSKDQLLWDLEENEGYNTRITGYGRDDASGTYQTKATTSYEEGPYFSDQLGGAYDSFDGNNSYNKPSRYRLLVLSHQQKDSIADGQYVIYGDNDRSIQTKTVNNLAGLKIMERQWLLKTNIPIPPPPTGIQTLNWNSNGVVFTETGDNVYSIKRESSVQAQATTMTPLLGDKGSISCTLTRATGPFNITYRVDNQDYGYHIGANGFIFKIFKGQLVYPQFGQAYIGTRIEVLIDGNTISILENGANNNHNIIIADENKGKSVYGSILFDTNNITLTNCIIDGFTDVVKGQTVELSYIDQRASEFKNYINGKSYLLIDRSGTGNFSSGDIEYHKMSEIDALRSKILFNNVFWDTDGNGKDIFTFGYKTSDIFGEITVSEPECEDGYQIENGNIHISMKEGLRGYTYSLVDVSTNKEVRMGLFTKDNYVIDSLASGTYDLTIKEIGGFNFQKVTEENGKIQAVTSNGFSSADFAYLEWIASEKSTGSSVGYMISRTNPTASSILNFHYGVYMDGHDLYFINNNTKDTTPFTTVQYGDRIRMERVGKTIYFSINGHDVLLKSINTSDPVYGVVNINNNGGEIINLKWSRFVAGTYWHASNGMEVVYSSQGAINHRVVIESGCDKKIYQSQIKSSITVTDNNNAFDVIATSHLSVTTRLTLDTPASVTMLAYNLGGSLVHKAERKTPQEIHEVRFDFPVPGVYILKAITADGEFSKKIIVQ